MQANKIYIYGRKKHTFTSYPTTKHRKQSKFAIPDMREKPVDFFLLYDTVIDFSSRNLGSFQKFPFL